MNTMIEAHFLGMNCQSNIYGIAPLQCGQGLHKVLIATVENNVYCIEYSKNQQGVIFSNREVQFTYIPASAEITSLDAFNPAGQVHTFAVGIAFTKKELDGKCSRYFNIYSDWEFGSECDLDNIALQGCLSIHLDFIPFHLTHSKLSINGKEEIVWLLSGNDIQVHLYRDDKTGQAYKEEKCDTYFPEFKDVNSPVLWIDIKNLSDSRITAVGCKNGTVKVSLIKWDPDIHVESSWTIQHDGPITSVKLFEDSGLESLPDNPIRKQPDRRKIHLLVTNSIEISVVYRDILTNGLDLRHQKFLARSNKSDVVTCGLIADINMDGYNEVLLGTFGQELLAYKWKPESQDGKGSYVLFHQQTFSHQILQMIYIDVMGDGLKELLILTNGGLHVMQHDFKKATNVIISRMKWLLDNVPAEELKTFLKTIKDE